MPDHLMPNQQGASKHGLSRRLSGRLLILVIVGALVAVGLVVGSVAAARTCTPPNSPIHVDEPGADVSCRLPAEQPSAVELDGGAAQVGTRTSTAAPATEPRSTSSAPVSSAEPDGRPRFSLTPVDGGAGYYDQWTRNSLPTSPGFFPLGVWMEQGDHADELVAEGLNMIVNPVSPSTNAAVHEVGALDDEADMWAGPGDGAWTGRRPGEGRICETVDPCGFSVMKAAQADAPEGSMRYANYGKGVAFWNSEAASARFMNEFQDASSLDLYWGTDGDICQASQAGQLLGTGAAVPEAECRKPSNYGRTVDRARSLVGGAKPIWNYVELGHPGTNGRSMPVAKIRPAVWSSLIHGARGIVYFNHSFGGTCQSQHVLQDCDPAIGEAVRAVNTDIKTLAPALNSPTVNDVTTTGSIDQLTKLDGRSLVVLTGSTRASGATRGSITLPHVGNTTAEVLGESRTVPVRDGTIIDTWADPQAVHTYLLAAD